MYILYRKKIIEEINSINEFENFILTKNFYKSFKKFPSNEINNIINYISKTNKLNYKSIKPELKKLLRYGNTQNDINFLLSMGWEKNEASEFIKEKQKNIVNKLVIAKKNSPEKFYDKTPTRIEYWLKLGHNFETATKLLHERQKTFSLEKCILKYGKDEGEKRFLNRQKKWISSLNKKEFSKNSYKYNEINHSDLIKRSNFNEKRKELILSGITKNTINEFVEYIVNNEDIKRVSDILPFVNSIIVQTHYKTTSNVIREKFYSLIPELINNNIYGFPIYYNGVRYKSIGEYKIALFLNSEKISFLYERNYPNSKSRYDFYLPKYNLFIEYFGLLKNKDEKKYNQIQLDYLNKMNKKINFCKENNLQLIFDVNCDIIINKLKKFIHENKN